MSNIVVTPDQFERAVMKSIAKYGDKANETIEAITKQVARDTAKTIKASAPAGGSYARGWSHKAKKAGRFKMSDTVYNRIEPQITHLLEKPHPTGYGKGYPQHVDYTGTIAKAEKEYKEKYIREVMARL